MEYMHDNKCSKSAVFGFFVTEIAALQSNIHRLSPKAPFTKIINSSTYSSILSILDHLSPHFQDISCILFPHENSLSGGEVLTGTTVIYLI